MARGNHVHAVAMQTPQVGWCPSGASILTEEEATKKVPEHLIALAMALEDDAVADVHTQPMCGFPVSTHEPLHALQQGELADAFASLDKLESERPSPMNVTVHQSGVVPAGSTLPQREVIPPPPRRPQMSPAATTAFEKSLEAFLRNDVPFQAEADNEQTLTEHEHIQAQAALVAADVPAKRHVIDYSLKSRAAVSRTFASGLLALCTVLVLFVIGGRPLTIFAPVARTPVTAHARADRTDPTGSARAQRNASHVAPAAPRFAPVAAPRFEPRRTATPARVATAPRTTGRIIRTSPF